MRAWLALALGVALLATGGCSSFARKQREATYAPTESVIEVVAVLQRHVPDDTYRFPPGQDFSGRNVYRASLLRLENLEQLHQASLKAGHLDGTIAFAKGRALERLRAYELAAQHFRSAARESKALHDAALRAAAVNEDIERAVTIGLQLDNPVGEGSGLLPLDDEQVIAELDDRIAGLTALLPRVRGSHYEAVVREEIERADVTRGAYFTAVRHVLLDGNLRAIGELQRVATRHPASKNQLRHLLAIADLYSTLAREYAAARPPETLSFDPPTFQELVDAATRLYERVAAVDGTPEKIEAARRLEAFLAFTLRVDGERFSPQ